VAVCAVNCTVDRQLLIALIQSNLIAIYLSRIAIFAYLTCHLHLMPLLGDFRRNIVLMFGMEKLEWFGYPIVKKV